MKSLQTKLLIFFLILISGSINAQEWVNTWGPEGGAILEIVEQGGNLYGRTATNLYISEDEGSTWSIILGEEFTNLTGGSLTATSFGVHLTATTSKVVSAYSADSLEASAEGFGQFEVPSKITAVADTLYSVAGANLYKSVDGAKTWSVAGSVGFGDGVFGTKEALFTASLTAGLKSSVDGGTTFEAFGPTLSFELVSSIVQLDSSYVFSTNQGVWAKNASGEWEKTFTKTGSFANLAVAEGAIYGLNGSISIVDGAIVGDADVYASADTGKTWIKVEVESDTKPIYGDHNKVVAVNGKLYATAIQKSNPMVSTDGGLNWASLSSSGLRNPAIRGIFSIEDEIYVTTNDGIGTGQFGYGVYKSSNNGDTWSQVPITLPEAHNGSFYTVRKNGSALYAGSYAGLFVSIDNGETWSIMSGTEEWYISDIHFTDNLWIMAGSDGFSRVWISADQGATWEAQFQGIGAVFEKIHESESAIVIGSNTTLIASTQDDGVTWHYANADSGLSLFGGGYYDVVSVGSTLFSLPINEENIYRSNDGGKNWEKATDLVGLTGVSFDKLFNKEGDLFLYGTKFAIVGGAFVYPKFLYKSTDGINFEEVMEITGVPNGFGSPSLAFAGEELLLGYKGTPIFKYSTDTMGTPNEEETTAKNEFKLSQNYPNPFNPSTNISFNVPQAGNVTLKVYNMLGQEVATLVNGKMSAGFQSIVFDASQFSSGMYIYRLQAGSVSKTKKMMLIK